MNYRKIIHFFFTLFVAVGVLSCTEELPLIEIKKTTNVGDIKEACTIRYSDSKRRFSIGAEIKKRGGMSSKYYKHSYTVELEKKFKLAGLPKDDDWILNASYIDKTFMRHKICYDLFREMSPNNVSSRCSYVRVNNNGQYEGLYVMMQEVNASLVGIDKQDTLSMLFKDPMIFHKAKLPVIKDPRMHYQKFPKATIEDRTYYLAKFKDFLFNSTDEEFAVGISKWIDLDNVVDWHLILLFSNNADGIMKNFYLYKKNAATPFRIAIWDYDHSFGRDGDNEMNMMKNELDCNQSILLNRLLQIKETGYIAMLKARWFELRKNDLIAVKSFEARMLANDRIIRAEIKRNFERWPVNSHWYFDDNTYNQEMELMARFVVLRIGQLDQYFNNL